MNKNLKIILQRTTPVYVFIILCLFVFILWWFTDGQRNIFLKNLIEYKVQEYSSYVGADLRARIPAIQRLVKRWEKRGGTPKAEFIDDIKNIINDLPGFQALGWVDKNYYVRWIAPLKGNEQALNLNLAFEKKRRIALELARNKGQPTMTSPIDLVQGGKGFLIYFPIFINKEFQGFVSAVFKADQWLQYVFNLPEIVNEREYFSISVQLNNEDIYKQEANSGNQYSAWQISSKITVLEKEISVLVEPTRNFFIDNYTYAPEIVSATALLLSLLISILVFLLQKMTLAKNKIYEINIALKHNIEERKRAEEKAKNASKAKSQFLSSMSHELRTPLNAIIGFSELLEYGAKDAKTKENIHEVVMAGNHLLDLVNEILDLSKIESGKMDVDVKNYNLNDMLDYCLAMITPAATKRGIQIINKVGLLPDIDIKVDEKRFKQVLINLLSNSIKYNNDNGTVIIEYSAGKGNMLCISINDNGIGLTPEQKNYLFKPFERVGANYSHVEGTGLGLKISKDLIELMDGIIWVESESGKGSVFWIEIPLA